MKVLFLDNDRNRHSTIKPFLEGTATWWTWRAAQSINMLRCGPTFDLALLDRDLGDEPSGEAVARYIVDMVADRRPKQTIVHSWNVERAKLMVRLLRQHDCLAVAIPFGPSLFGAIVEHRKQFEGTDAASHERADHAEPSLHGRSTVVG